MQKNNFLFLKTFFYLICDYLQIRIYILLLKIKLFLINYLAKITQNKIAKKKIVCKT